MAKDVTGAELRELLLAEFKNGSWGDIDTDWFNGDITYCGEEESEEMKDLHALLDRVAAKLNKR